MLRSQLLKRFLLVCVMSALLFCTVGVLADPIVVDEIALPAGMTFGMSIEEAQAVSNYKKDIAADTRKIIVDKMGFESEYLSGSATVGGNAASVYVYFDQLRRYNITN